MSVFSVSQIGSQIDRESNAEVRSHIEMRTADIIAAGMPPEKARRDALLKFGNPTVMRERVAGVDFALNLDIFFRDVQYAFRKLRKTPAFAITVILGIGGPSVYQSCELPVCRPYGNNPPISLRTVFRRLLSMYPHRLSRSDISLSDLL
jgi:hypothetical protein